MPLLSSSDPSGTVRPLPSQNYSDNAISGVGLTKNVYLAMTRAISLKRPNLDALVKIMVESLGQENSGVLQNQARAAAQSSVMSELRARVPQTQAHLRGQSDLPVDEWRDQVYPAGPVLKPVSSTAKPFISMEDLRSVTFDVQQSARILFTAGQQILVSKMITEWLTIVTDLIQCATDAEVSLEKIVGDINAERQAIWTLVGGVIGGVLTYSVPPPFGAILGAVVTAVCTEDKWTKCIPAAGKLGVQANMSGGSSAVLGPYEMQTIYGKEKISDFKDWFAFVGGAPSCLGKQSKDVFKSIDEKTLKHLTDLPAPPKAQSKGAAGVIKQQCNEKIQAISYAVNQEMGDFINTESGPASLVQASWDYQASAISGAVKRLAAGDRAQFVRDRLKEGCLLYLNSAAHEILETLAKESKPKLNRLTMDTKPIQKQFEILFWAHYLATSALDRPKSYTSLKKGDDQYAHKYGTLKKGVWRNQVEEKLKDLGITMQFASPSRLPFAGKSDLYQLAIQNWTPPTGSGPWMPVPYEQGGTNAQGRLAAWAVEYTKRTPVELYRAILP